MKKEKVLKPLRKSCEKTVEYLTLREAFSESKAVYLEDDDVRMFLEESIETVPFVFREKGKYWIDKEILDFQIRRRKIRKWVNRIIFLLAILGGFIYLFTYSRA